MNNATLNIAKSIGCAAVGLAIQTIPKKQFNSILKPGVIVTSRGFPEFPYLCAEQLS